MDAKLLGSVMLIALASACVFYAFVYPYFTGQLATERRLKALLGSGNKVSSNVLTELAKREQVANTIREMEIREKAQNKLTLEKRIAYAGLNWSKSKFFLVSFAGGVGAAFVFFVFQHQLLFMLMGFLFGSTLVPLLFLNYLRKRREKKFIADLPIAIDTVVRGVRIGLPVRDCLQTIVSEMTGPLQESFRDVIDALALGLPLREAIYRVRDRMPVPEANFLCIAISLQQVSGGNLSTTFSNLSNILRERKKMFDKVQAYSMEAKASAVIIGSLPIGVLTIVSISSPSYMEPLFNTTTGHYILAGCGMWMLIGSLIMKKMINFRI